MSGPGQAAGIPLFLDAKGRRIFAVTGEPGPAAGSHGILICPAFAEEMNRARRTVSLLRREAALRGLWTICPDLHGTGDSAGEFADARWDHWLEDLETAAAWLHGRGCTRISLVGVRAGALLAWDLLRRNRAGYEALVLWQPMLAGKSVVTDMLRTRIAAAVGQGTRETVAALRRQLDAGQAVEAAGYMMAPELVSALDDARIDTDEWVPAAINWLEIVADDDSATRQPVLNMVSRLQAAGARVDLHRQKDPPFWSTVETTVGQGTARATARLLADAT